VISLAKIHQQVTRQKSVAMIKVKYNFVDVLKSAHFVIILAQNARISVNFCAFSAIFETSLFCV